MFLAIAVLLATLRTPEIRVDPTTGMELVRIHSGAFLMGAPERETGREKGETQHRVRISRDFWLGRTEVTQQQWMKVMETNPSHFAKCGPGCPVENVTFVDVQEFLSRLNARTKDGRFRLPTEAEWEFACRAGTTTPFSTGENLTTDQANYDGRYPYAKLPRGTYRETTLPVGSFAPNPWGLFDMHGNVWEWCKDWFCPYPRDEATDPIGDCDSGLRVIRGGSWYFNAESARAALRYTHPPNWKGFSIGFRVVFEEEANQKPEIRNQKQSFWRFVLSGFPIALLVGGSWVGVTASSDF